MPDSLFVAKASSIDISLDPRMANRHGLVTGATGTGKTITLQVLAERFSSVGVPVFVSDVKGDLAGISQAGTSTPKLAERLGKLSLPEPSWGACPVTFWDLFGEQGHPVRATVSDLGPLLFSRLLGLNETQEGVLLIAFKVADDNGLLLIDLNDLRAVLQFIGDHAKELRTQYGNVSGASIGAIQRGLLQLEGQGATGFFGEPMLDMNDLLQTRDGKGVVNILAADRLLHSPRAYAAMLLWLLSELFENLPEVGDPEKPRLVYFFDEAHLLFDDAPAALVDRIELVVRLIRSKGVGVWFVTQSPTDIPDAVLGQLGNRVQHALRAFTPKDQKAVRATAETMRPNPAFDLERAITELGTGEALVSMLDAKGAPSVTERAWMLAPGSRIGPITPAERAAVMQDSLVKGVYDAPVDRESAFEMLRARAAAAERAAPSMTAQATASPATGGISEVLFGSVGPRGGRRDGLVDLVAKSASRTVGSTIGRSLVRGVLGSLLGKRR